MARLRTHYATLKVSHDAPIEVIQAAYRSLARKHHPDRNDGGATNEAIMKAINEAYEVLSDPVKRVEHDRWIAAQRPSQADAPDESESSQNPGNQPSHPPRSFAGVIFRIIFFATALWLLRYPSLRYVGMGMLVAAWLFLVRLRR